MAGRGFGALTVDERRALSSKGGKAAHAAGTAHQFTSEEAKKHAAKGGRASQAAARKRKEEAQS